MTDVEQIKVRLDIADIIGEYVQLRPAGANLKGVCPFHDESTPSFMVHRGKQIFRCFGCGVGGDMFSFIEQHENVEFPEALQILAQKAGVKLKSYDAKKENSKTRLKDITELCVAFYEKQLWADIGKPARDYLITERKLSEETIKKFRIGFAPSGWEHVSSFLRSRKFRDAEVIQSGMVIQKEGRTNYYDRFRERIMFPIFDTHGSAIAFTGRLLPGAEKNEKAGGKYINSPETPIFHKSHVLYGLNYAKERIKKSGAVLFAEGQMDVVASHEAGVEHIVAASGTALTDDHFRLLKRFTDTIVFTLDADTAGKAARERSVLLAWAHNMNAFTVSFTGSAKDPADVVANNPDEWKALVEQRTPAMEQFITEACDAADLSSPEGKKLVAKQTLPLLKMITNPIEQAHYIDALGSKLGVASTYISEALTKTASPEVPTKPIEPAPSPSTPHQSTHERMETHLLALCIHFPEILALLEKDLKQQKFSLSPLSEGVYNILKSGYTNADTTTHKKQSSGVPLEYEDHISLLELLGEKEFAELDIKQAKHEYRSLFNTLIRHHITRALADIEQQLKHHESAASADPKTLQKLSTQFTDLTQQLRSLNDTV